MFMAEEGVFDPDEVPKLYESVGWEGYTSDVDRPRAAGHLVAQAVTMGGNAGLHSPAEALPQMEPVSDLQSVGGTASGALGVGARPVPAANVLVKAVRATAAAASPTTPVRANRRAAMSVLHSCSPCPAFRGGLPHHAARASRGWSCG